MSFQMRVIPFREYTNGGEKMNHSRSVIRLVMILGLILFFNGCGSSGGDSSPSSSGGGGSSSGIIKILFLHHSVGENLIHEGNMRAAVAAYNAANGTSCELWDHSYNDQGLFNAGGASTGISYNIPGDNTNPDGFHNLWLNVNEPEWTNSRNQIMNNYRVIAFKSCFVALYDLNSAGDLTHWKNMYLAMRTYFDLHPEKLFVVVTPPPLRAAETNAASAALARQFADWLQSAEYLSGHPNMTTFDLFGHLANAGNVLRPDYDSGDSHPNGAANAAIGPVFAGFLCDRARAYFR